MDILYKTIIKNDNINFKKWQRLYKQKTQGRNSYGHQPVKKCITSEMVKWMNVKLWDNTFTHQAGKNDLKWQKSEWWEQNKQASSCLAKGGHLA